ncbi:hypothetical protein J7I97_35165 [Streptomyces sp. ISL-87]|nr:hypothetical protein [Streptomyces sp. ISL-87]MBT2613315.1 hypothetical protein [Streptomyces sp. ISL-87]
MTERGSRAGAALQDTAQRLERSVGGELLDDGQHPLLLVGSDLDVRHDHHGAQDGDEVQDADGFDFVGVLANLSASARVLARLRAQAATDQNWPMAGWIAATQPNGVKRSS